MFRINHTVIPPESIEEICDAVFSMAQTQTGALIVISTRKETLTPYIQTGEIIDARISSALLQNIFYKNTPLHDGAVLIVGKKIIAAKCVLPMTKRTELPMGYGMRHRSALGMSEDTDSLVLVVSEQTGGISYCQRGEITPVEDKETLVRIINQNQETL